MRRLPDTELEVMKALWASGPDTPRAALDQALAAFQWSPNTINTYLTRLMEKGFVSVRREGKSNRYTPWSPGRTIWPLTAGWCSPGCTEAPPGILWLLWPRADSSRRTWMICRTC